MKYIYTLTLILISLGVKAQLQATFDTTLNNVCNGTDCDYEGPSILINEIMITPFSGDGSLSGASTGTQRGEWIELYNPDICEPVDISCYFLGNNTQEGGGGYIIPQGTIVPPGGFCVLRGTNAPAVPANKLVENGGNVVELIAPNNISGDNICAGGNRLWFPNAGGWFAFYNAEGEPQDAISWGENSSSIANGSGFPCMPSQNCSGTTVGSLDNFNSIPADRKHTFIVPGGMFGLPGTPETDKSILRIPDGGAWSTSQATPTFADCNDECAELGSSSCDGTATINVTGGSGNYSYAWNDSEAQMTQTAVGLCDGTYQVVVTDTDSGESQTFTVEIDNIVISASATSTPSTCGNDDGSITVVGADGAAPYTYTVDGGTSQGSGTFDHLGSGSYNYTAIDANGCVATGTQSVVDVGGIEITAVNTVDPTCFGDCDGSVSIEVDADPATLVFSVVDEDGNEVGTSANVGDLCAGNYSLTVTDENGCSSSATFSLTTPEEVDATFDLTDFCAGADNSASNIATSGGTFSIVSPSGDGAEINSSTGEITGGVAGTTYTVTYETPDGCASSTETVTVLYTPIIDMTAAPVVGNPPLDVVFENNTAGTNTFDWDFGDGNTAIDNDGVVEHTYHDVGTFEVVLTATSDDGCVATEVVEIVVTYPDMEYEFPNVFSPNGDGVNDVYKMVYEENVASIEVVILNRWGNVVFEYESSDDVYFEWNGRVKNTGVECSEGVYFYKALLRNYSGDEKIEHGYIHLNR